MSTHPATVMNSATPWPWYHFSIDDVFVSLIEVTDKNIPLFEHPLFKLLKDMHDLYGTSVGLYLFYEKEMQGITRTLEEVRDLSVELEEAEWIHFGPHALNYETHPYTQVPDDQIVVFNAIYKQIDRFAGAHTYAKWVRLHFYSESYELVDYFTQKNVEVLFSTDRASGSHRMPEHIKNTLLTNGFATHEGMNFIRTHFRIEFFVDENRTEYELKELFQGSVSRYGHVIIYSHEVEFVDKKARSMFRLVCEVLHKMSIKSVASV